MNSKNSGTSDPCKLFLDVTHKIYLRELINMLFYHISHRKI